MGCPRGIHPESFLCCLSLVPPAVSIGALKMGALTIGLEWLQQMLGLDSLSTYKSSRVISIEKLEVGALNVGLDRLRQ